MNKLLLATKNLNKITEIKKAFSSAKSKSLGIEILSLNDFPEMPDVIEDGDTLEYNSLKKAREFFEYANIPTLADDTGLEIDFLNGAPGVYSARFAGENCSYEDNNIKTLKLLNGVPVEKRGAKFRTVITLYQGPDKTIETSEGVLEGEIIEENTGKKGFGYDPIFKPKGDNNSTLAELTLDEKNKISHRGLAVAQIIKKIVKIIKSSKQWTVNSRGNTFVFVIWKNQT